MQTTLATRYARALADVAGEKNILDATADELERFAGLYQASKPLRDFLLNPAFPLPRKREAVAKLGSRAKISETTVRFIHVLLQNGRIDLLPEVALQFRRRLEEIQGRITVEVTTAVPLTPAQDRRLSTSLAGITGKQVRLETRVDPTVVGGVRARVGSEVYDGTVATRLDKLKQKLLGDR